MKAHQWLAASLLVLLFASGCERQSIYTGKLVLEGNHSLESGVIVDAHLLVLGGEYHIQPGAELSGSAVLVSGALVIDGQISGDVSQYGGTLVVGPRGHIAGRLSIAGGEQRGLFQYAAEGGVSALPQPEPPLSPGRQQGSGLQTLWWPFFQALSVAALAALTARFSPRPLQRVSTTIQQHYIVALALGLLAGVVGLVLMVQMIFTVILIPVTGLGLLALALTVAFGWGGFGLIFGRFLFHRLQRRASLPWQAFTGTLLFMLLAAVLGALPVLGDLLVILSAVIGLGAVLLTRFGLVDFKPAVY